MTRLKTPLAVILLMFLAMCAGRLIAQSQLTSSSIPEFGSGQVDVLFDLSVDATPVGPNVRWDFTAYDYNQQDSFLFSNRVILRPDQCPFSDSFPTATHCIAQVIDFIFDSEVNEELLDSFDFYSYLSVREGEVLSLGGVSSLGIFEPLVTVEEDPDLFPLVGLGFGQTVIDTLAYEVSEEITFAGQVNTTTTNYEIQEVEYDAYGSINLPGYDLDNVMRIVTTIVEVTTVKEVFVSNGQDFSSRKDSIVSEIIGWYHPSSILPVAQIVNEYSLNEMNIVGGVSTIEEDSSTLFGYSIDFSGDGSSSSVEVLMKDHDFGVYPTHSDGVFTVDMPLTLTQGQLTMYNMNGQKVFRTNIGAGKNMIETDLPPGSYYLSLPGFSNQKIIVF